MSFGKPAKILIAGAILSLGVVLYLIYGKGPVAPDDGGPDTVATVAGRSITAEEFSAQMVRRSGGFVVRTKIFAVMPAHLETGFSLRLVA